MAKKNRSGAVTAKEVARHLTELASRPWEWGPPSIITRIAPYLEKHIWCPVDAATPLVPEDGGRLVRFRCGGYWMLPVGAMPLADSATVGGAAEPLSWTPSGAYLNGMESVIDIVAVLRERPLVDQPGQYDADDGDTYRVVQDGANYLIVSADNRWWPVATSGHFHHPEAGAMRLLRRVT